MADWPALLDGDKAWAERCVKLHPAYLGSNPDQRAPRIAFLRTHLAAVDLAHIQPPAGTGLACLDKARATRKGEAGSRNTARKRGRQEQDQKMLPAPPLRGCCLRRRKARLKFSGFLVVQADKDSLPSIRYRYPATSWTC